jgi:uncharacterized protein (TIGR02217 family)
MIRHLKIMPSPRFAVNSNRRADDLAAVVAFFEARNGRLYGFRWKDWGDYKSCLPSGAPTATDRVIGTGDGTTTAFQLVKAYSSGAQT